MRFLENADGLGGGSSGRHRFSNLTISGPLNGPEYERRKLMNDQNRVLIRRGARALTEEESALVNGALLITLSLCTNQPSPDGDHRVGEVGC